MKKTYVLGNWKSNKTVEEARAWIDTFHTTYTNPAPDTIVIVCPQFIHLPLFTATTFPAAIGAQNISAFPTGAYTGEIAAASLTGLVSHVMIGHSERRTHCGETDSVVIQKVTRAQESGIIPVVCVSEIEQVKALADAVPEFSSKGGMLLYEPLSAIGTGQADSPERANAKAMEIAAIIGEAPILYGGSVVPENVHGFTAQSHISGVGVGGASLDATKFINVIRAAAQTV